MPRINVFLFKGTVKLNCLCIWLLLKSERPTCCCCDRPAKQLKSLLGGDLTPQRSLNQKYDFFLFPKCPVSFSTVLNWYKTQLAGNMCHSNYVFQKSQTSFWSIVVCILTQWWTNVRNANGNQTFWNYRIIPNKLKMQYLEGEYNRRERSILVNLMGLMLVWWRLEKPCYSGHGLCWPSKQMVWFLASQK